MRVSCALWAVALSALASIPAGMSARAASPFRSRETLIFVERATTDRISVHAGPAADNVGDILTFSNPVFDEGNQKQVATDQGYCVRMVVGKAFECHWTLTLPAGQLTVDGPFFDSGDSKLAVTGGTESYVGARGQLLLHPRDAKGSAFDFTYELR